MSHCVWNTRFPPATGDDNVVELIGENRASDRGVMSLHGTLQIRSLVLYIDVGHLFCNGASASP